MSVYSPRLQTHYFYEGVFTAEMDNTLLRSLVTQKKQYLTYAAGKIPDEAQEVARLTVNHVHAVKLTLKDVVKRIKFLKYRFDVFKIVANFEGTNWDYTNNYVHADDSVWAEISKTCPLGRAYRFKGEPEFHNLAIVFGADKVKLEGAKKVANNLCAICVVNSSSTVELQSNGNRTVVLDDDDEVTSPMLKSARRKLKFVEATPSSPCDELSGTNDVAECPFYHDPRIPGPNAFPMKPRLQGGKLRHGSSSSCASSSPQPYKWGPFQ